MNLEKARKMRNVYKKGGKRWAEDTKQKNLRNTAFTKQKHSKRYRILCHYIEETQSLYKPNVQNHLSEIVNYRQNGYFSKKICKKVLQNAQMWYILKLRKRLSYKTDRTK